MASNDRHLALGAETEVEPTGTAAAADPSPAPSAAQTRRWVVADHRVGNLPGVFFEPLLELIDGYPLRPVGDLHELSLVRRQFIYRVAAALTKVDLEVDPTEQTLLDRLRIALELAPGEVAELDLGVRKRSDAPD